MHCLRCGRKMEEEFSFCDSCTELVQEPLEETPNLTTNIILSPPRAVPVIKRAEPKKERKKRPVGWIFTVALLFLVCAALVLQGGWYYRSLVAERSELEQMAAKTAALQEDIDALTDALSKSTQENAQLETLLNSLQQDLSDAQVELVDLEQKILHLSQSIVFLNDEDDETFHRSGCVRFYSRDFLAYIKDDAVQLGYAPCELCLP